MATKKTTAKKKVAKKAPARKRVAKKKSAAKTTPKPNPGKRSPKIEALVRYALGFPEAWLDHPWGEHVTKVKKKVFVFFGVTDEHGLSVKLPVSGPSVLEEPYASPTGYGLGKSGWVTIKLDGEKIPKDQLHAWIEESYLAVAPKTLAKMWLE